MRHPALRLRLGPAILALALALALAPAAGAQRAAPALPPIPDIPFQKFVLDNGLTLIVHEDHKAPIVAVNVWYHVGSKNERPGKTGFAHLFEHLMFNGSEHFDQDYFEPFEAVGATDMNGTTNPDRTNYFQNVPTNALDLALWMESDRMGHLLGAVTQAKLDEQRGVVQNEKRQGENQPYGRARELLTRGTYPPGHPYSWTTIGSMEDLNAATLEDVREWFRTYYGAANAVISIAGDVTAETALEKVKHYFGDIPSGPPLERQEAWIARRTGTHRQQMQDRVPQARIYKVWNVPEWGTPEVDYLTLAAGVLASGKTSRLYERLVYRDRIATDVAAFVSTGEIGSTFQIWVTAKPGGDLGAVERALDEELARFLAGGPTARELLRVKMEARSNFIRGIERIGGFGGKSDVLAMNQVYAGRPDYYKVIQERLGNATALEVRNTARAWLADGAYVLEVHPFPDYTAAPTGADRSRLPEAGTPPEARFPDLERTELSNGLKVVLARRASIPQVNVTLLVDAGFASDAGGLPGTASLAMAMLDEGTRTRSALAISERQALLGARLFTGSGLDMSYVTLSALKANLDSSLALFADVILEPVFPEDEFVRQREQRLAQIKREKSQPGPMAQRVIPALLYGPGHPYGHPFSGTGTEESVGRMTRETLAAWHRTWFRPNNAVLVVVGDASLAELRPRLERLLGGWTPGPVPDKALAAVPGPARSAVYLIDRPGAIQSQIYAALLAPPRANPDEDALEVMNELFGGTFGSRVNMNLREDKHWSYGARSFVWQARGQRPFLVSAPVQTDKTKESVAEILKELRGILGERPVEEAELAKAKASLTLTLPGQWETMSAVSASLEDLVTFGLDDRYYDGYAARIRNVTAAQVVAAARKLIEPGRVLWVVVGDRAKVEAGLRELDLGPVTVVDPDGKPVVASTGAQ